MEIALWAHRRFKHQPVATGPVNARDNQMAKANVGTLLTEIQANGACEPNSPTKANTGYPNTPEKQILDLKSLVMMLLEEHKKDINNSLKEIQEKMDPKVEALTRETQK